MPEPLDQARARALVAQITEGLDKLRDAIIQLWEGRGWIALGYLDWDDLCVAEFKMRLQLPRTVRLQVVSQLTDRGMSARAIGSALGVSRETVNRDRGDTNVPPVVGLDGKRYRVKPTKPTEVVPLRRNQPVPQPWMVIILSLSDAARAIAPCERTLHALPTELAARDADRITNDVQRIRRVLDTLSEHLETG